MAKKSENKPKEIVIIKKFAKSGDNRKILIVPTDVEKDIDLDTVYYITISGVMSSNGK